MYPFSYRTARSEQDAITAGMAGGRYLAGGTTLVDLMREEIERPGQLIDINRLALRDIRLDGTSSSSARWRGWRTWPPIPRRGRRSP